MARKSPRLPEDDDGRTIADMNVEGMPWYVKGRADTPAGDHESEPLSREDARRYTWAAVAAALLVAAVFAVVLGLFIAFCALVWFR